MKVWKDSLYPTATSGQRPLLNSPKYTTCAKKITLEFWIQAVIRLKYTSHLKTPNPQLAINLNKKFWAKENRQESRGPPTSDSCFKKYKHAMQKNPKPTDIFFSVRRKKSNFTDKEAISNQSEC